VKEARTKARTKARATQQPNLSLCKYLYFLNSIQVALKLSNSRFCTPISLKGRRFCGRMARFFYLRYVPQLQQISCFKGAVTTFLHLVITSLFVFITASQQSLSFIITENDTVGSSLFDRKHRFSVGSRDFSFASSRSSIDEQNFVPSLSKERNTRAGQDGFSLLRQPLQRDTWDSSRDPKFKAPKELNDDGRKSDKRDSDWWSSKKNGARVDRTNAVSYNDARSSEVPLPSAIPDGDQTLDLFQRSSDTLDFPIILGALRAQCYTIPAKKIVDDAADQSEKKQYANTKKSPKPKQKGKQPLEAQFLLANNPQKVREQYQAVSEMQRLLDTNMVTKNDLRGAYYKNRRGIKVSIGNGNPPPLDGVSFDLESILKICSEDGEVLEGPEILEISTMMNAIEDIQLWARALEKIVDDSEGGDEELSSSSSNMFVEIPRIVNSIDLNTTLQTLLEEAFDNEGRLSGTTFTELGLLRAKVRTLKADILQTLDNIVQLPSIKSKLALESGGPLYSEVASSRDDSSGGRLVLPIDPKYASDVGIVHDSSRSGKTVYVEPSEIVGPTNELRQIERELEAEEVRVWRSLTEQVWNNQYGLRKSIQAIAQLDLCVARCTLGQAFEGVIPIVKDEGTISLNDAKHPVLLLRKLEKVVGSDISLGANGNQGLVLTGPNSGGKTVILKLLGLLALMTRSGIPIPAAHGDSNSGYFPRVDFFNPVLADIGDIQSVDSDLSTFSGHMLVCKNVLELAQTGNALVLMDELGSGTDPVSSVRQRLF